MLAKLLEIKNSCYYIFKIYLHMPYDYTFYIIPGCPPDVTEFALITLRQFITIKTTTIVMNFNV
jgi:hypothetical protein